MSPALAVQTKQYGAITAFDFWHERRLIASLIKEKANLVDYSHQRTFGSLDAAVEFYLMTVAPHSSLEKVRGNRFNVGMGKLLSPIRAILGRL